VNRDYSDMLSALFEERVDFLIVGAFALAAHGLPRATGDIDIWVRSTPDNATRLWKALQRFKAPLSRVTEADFCLPDIVYQIGTAPHRIDILTSISGVVFDDAWQTRTAVLVDGQMLPVISREQLLKNKRAAGRPKDLLDVAWLEGQSS